MKVLSTVALALFLSACTNVLLRPSNFPFFSGTYYPMTNRGQHPVIFTVNGCYLGKQPSDWTVEPGELATVRLWNLSGGGAQVTVNFQKIDRLTGLVIGAANDYVWVSEERRSEAVILTDEAVTRCGSIICHWQ